MIDLCITTSPDKIIASDVIPLGISDHSLVYMCRKIHYSTKNSKRVITKRSFRHFNSKDFIRDLDNQDWDVIALLSNPNDMWDVWKQKSINWLDKHTPLRSKRIGNRRSPWINNDLLGKIHKRRLGMILDAKGI